MILILIGSFLYGVFSDSYFLDLGLVSPEAPVGREGV
jgi:hypothetical protein